MSRKTPLRSSFVVTVSAVAAAALALACGGKTSGDDPGAASTTCTSSTTLGDACVATESECAPKGPNVRDLRCVEGKWVVNGMWNPPRLEAPLPPSEPTPAAACVCPSTTPKPGSSCAACTGDYPAECTYPTSADCPPLVTSCDLKTLTWSNVAVSCNPPPPDGGAADGG